MNEELNKKIAEWCGLKSPHIDDLGHAIYWKEGYEGWCPVPHFTRSLDACFKYIVPKLLEEMEYKYELCATTAPTQHRVTIRDKGFNLVGKCLVWDESPALALCRAVEKLIDEGT